MMLVKDVRKKVETIVRAGNIAKKDVIVKKFLDKLGPLIIVDKQKNEVPGFPGLNEVSPKTKEVVDELTEYCENTYSL